MVDMLCTLLFLGAMLSGYISGGFREIFRVAVMIGLMVLFVLPSVKVFFLQFGSVANAFFVITFFALYIVLNMIVSWLLKGLIESRDGVLGGMNKALGVIAGFLKASMLMVFAAYIVQFLWSKRLLAEMKHYLDDSFIFSVANAVLNFLV